MSAGTVSAAAAAVELARPTTTQARGTAVVTGDPTATSRAAAVMREGAHLPQTVQKTAVRATGASTHRGPAKVTATKAKKIAAKRA
jgi:hypothetical protein